MQACGVSELCVQVLPGVAVGMHHVLNTVCCAHKALALLPLLMLSSGLRPAPILNNAMHCC